MRMTRVFAMFAAVAVVLVLGANAEAQLPKEGTYSGIYSSFGTAKVIAVGKERLLVVFDEGGLTVGKGVGDHMTWRCWGTADFMNGAGQAHGYCVGTDPAGDQLAGNFGDEKHTPDQQSWSGSIKWTTGTGKFVGITGGHSYVIHSNEFRPTTEGTYVNHATYEGGYKLP
jgi:hypothetical protein